MLICGLAENKFWEVIESNGVEYLNLYVLWNKALTKRGPWDRFQYC